MRDVLAFLSVLFVTTALIGCGRSNAASPSATQAAQSFPIGDHCVVVFRRDALGGAANGPLAPEAENINGASISVDGILRNIDADWIVIATKDRDYWVSRDAVLMLKLPALKPSPTSTAR